MENKKDISLIKIIKKIYSIVFKAYPVYVIIWILVGVTYGLSHGINTYVTQEFFDIVTKAVGNSGSINKIIILACVLGAVVIFSQILDGVYSLMSGNFTDKLKGYFLKNVNEKCARFDAANYEDAKFLDMINKAKNGVDGSTFLVYMLTTLCVFNIPYLIFMSIYLYSLDHILVIILVLIFIPVVLTQIIRVKIYDKLENEIAPIQRENSYYEKCICDIEYFKETRMLGAFGYFKKLYMFSMNLFGKKVWEAEKKTAIIELIMKSITLVGYFLVFCLLINSLFKGNITVGAFGAVYASISLMFEIIEEIVSNRIGSIARDLGAIRNFIDFFELPERGGTECTLDSNKGVVLKNVSFSYHLAKEYSLKNISLEVKPNETIAIVGENGAGKSTLVKLIMGLYLPTEGVVELGGAYTKEVSYKSICEGISGVFQKYQRYKMTLLENIVISNMGREDIKNTINRDETLNGNKVVQLATEKAGLNIYEEGLNLGYDTILAREFGGVDISGGQWQRVALASGFYRSHDMIILDEPTAAIDPLEEARIYKKFAAISEGKTSIIVTHRLGSAKLADRIIVMNKGRIVEIGTHDELINMDGKYAKLYKSQAQWYTRENDG